MRAKHALRPAAGTGPATQTGDAESAFARVRVGAIDLAVVDRGPTEASGADAPRVPLVLLHGFTGHRDDWIGVLPELAKTRRVVAFDLRGHGDSSSNQDDSGYTFEQFVKDVIGLLDVLEIGQCDLLGHSVGGMIAQRLAHAHPDRVRSLILMSTAPAMPDAIPQAGMEQAASIAVAKGMTRFQELAEAAARAEVDPIIERWGDRYWRHHRRRLTAMTPESYRGIGAMVYREGSFAPHLGEIVVPTLVLCGVADRSFRAGGDALIAGLPEARTECVWIEDAGHHPHQENPDAWFRAIEDHFARQDARDASPH